MFQQKLHTTTEASYSNSVEVGARQPMLSTASVGESRGTERVVARGSRDTLSPVTHGHYAPEAPSNCRRSVQAKSEPPSQ